MVFPNLRAEMARQGIDPAHLADTAGVSVRTVYKWLDGSASPRTDKAKVVSEALGFPMGYLFGDEPAA